MRQIQPAGMKQRLPRRTGAYAVCQSVGPDANSASRDYVQLWDGDTKMLTASLERIRRTAIEIIEAVTPGSGGRAGGRNSDEPETAGAAGRVNGVSPHGFGAAT